MKFKKIILTCLIFGVQWVYAENPIAINKTVQSSWDTQTFSTHRSTGTFAKYFTFVLTHDTIVTIDLTAGQDTYLYLLSGNSRNGTEIAHNDDGGAGTNSKIIQQLSPGTYTVEATTFSTNKLGNFLIRVNDPLSPTLKTYFGEDNTGRINSDNAKRTFFANLSSVGTENFESYTTGSTAPLNINFGLSGSASLNGSGVIKNGETSYNTKPTSGTKFWDAATGDFTITFSSPVSAFGFYATDVGDVSGSLSINYTNGTTHSIPVGNTVGGNSGTTLYFGMIEKDLSKAFSSITFINDSSSDYFGFDDMSIATKAQIRKNQYMVKNDFNGDGVADILWRHTSGQYLIYYMLPNGSRGRYTYGFTIPTTWSIVATNDFNGDNITDILWRHKDGQYLIFYMLPNGSRGRYSYGSIVPTYYKIEDTNDFNRDGIADILWRNKNNGQYLIYFMNADGSRRNYKFGSNVPLYYTFEDTNDFDGDGIADILWRNKNTGQYLIYFMNTDGSRRSYKFGSNVPLYYTLEDTNDFNGDGITDILWRNKNTGQYLIYYMNQYGSRSSYKFGLTVPKEWSIQNTVDFNADGIADILWRHTSGQYLFYYMNADGSRKGFKYGYIINPNWEIQPK